jgi:hypothetical protein
MLNVIMLKVVTLFYQWAGSRLELSLSFKIAASQFWNKDFF